MNLLESGLFAVGATILVVIMALGMVRMCGEEDFRELIEYLKEDFGIK